MFCSKEMNRKYVHERALQLVYVDYCLSFKELRKDNSITIKHRNIHNVSIEMYKRKKSLSPPVMYDLIIHKGCGPITRTWDKFVLPNVNTVHKGDNSLRSFGPVVWNNMPKENVKIEF